MIRFGVLGAAKITPGALVNPCADDERADIVCVAPAYLPAEQNFFERLMELERRKNAWLRRTFLGIP